MPEKEITNTELARMVAEGFTTIRQDMQDGFAEAKSDLNEFKEETRENFRKVDQNFAVIEDDLQNINLQLEQITPTQDQIIDHDRRITANTKKIERIELQQVA